MTSVKLSPIVGMQENRSRARMGLLLHRPFGNIRLSPPPCAGSRLTVQIIIIYARVRIIHVVALFVR